MGDWDFVCALCASSFDNTDHIRTVCEEMVGSSDDGEIDDGDESTADSAPHFFSEESTTRLSAVIDNTPASVLNWHGQLHALSFNPTSSEVTKAYITGLGSSDDYGGIKAQPGSEPSAPKEDQDENGEIMLTAYSLPESTFASAVPMHHQCLFGILPKVVGYVSGEPAGEWTSWIIDRLNRDLLWESFQPLIRDYQFCTELDHYERNRNKAEQYWHIDKNDMWCITDPVEIPALEKYLKTCPEIPMKSRQQSASNIRQSSGALSGAKDPFLRLHEDIVLYLSDFLSVKCILALRIASRAVASLALTPAFWKRRIYRDMPWVWELQSISPVPDKKGQPSSYTSSPVTSETTLLNWKTVYCDLHFHSFCLPHLHTLRHSKPGLWNRRRVWMTCEQFASLYCRRMKKQRGFDSTQLQDAKIRQCTFSSHLPLVATGVSKTSVPFRLPLLLHWDQNIKNLDLLTYWNSAGLLVGLELVDHDCPLKKTTRRAGETSNLEQRSILLSSRDWIESLEVTMTALDMLQIKRTPKDESEPLNGIIGIAAMFRSGNTESVRSSSTAHEVSKRLFNAYHGSTIVGLQGSISDDSHAVISRLGLLEAFYSSEHLPVNLSLPGREARAWKNAIPESIFEPKAEQLGYWLPRVSQDVIPRETLIFGATDAERAHVTGLSIEDTLLRFEVHFDDEPSQCIGNSKDRISMGMGIPRQPRTKYFPIDGKHGERVIGIQLQVNALPFQLRIVTNHNRQAFFGDYWTDRNGGRGFLTYVGSYGKAVGGLYGSYGYVSGNSVCLSSISVLLVPSNENDCLSLELIADLSDASVDEDNNFWDPSLPPSTWRQAGPVYGSKKTNGVVTYLDLSRFIARIDIIEYSSPNIELTPASDNPDGQRRVTRVRWSTERPSIRWIKGLRIVYADGDIRTVAGAPADEVETIGDMYEQEEEREKRLKHGARLTRRWEAKADPVRAERVRIWTDGHIAGDDETRSKRSSSLGLQFFLGGEWGPEWGDCWGEPVAELKTSKDDGAVVGLKVFIGTGGSCESSTIKDPVNCTAVQAFVLKH